MLARSLRDVLSQIIEGSIAAVEKEVVKKNWNIYKVYYQKFDSTDH